jgi:hypothetical protein
MQVKWQTTWREGLQVQALLQGGIRHNYYANFKLNAESHQEN